MSTSIDDEELAKFAQLSKHWWDKDGPLKTLHDINATRLIFIEQAGSLAGKRILDVGTGGGILAEVMAARGASVTGIDAEKEAIEVASQHSKQQGYEINYHPCAIENFEAAPFDCITCMELLEHTPHPELIIQHCARLLKPQGFLFVSTISRTLRAYLSAVIAAEYILSLLPKQTHDYQKFIKPAELAAMARAVNLDLFALKGLAYNPFSRQASLEDSVAVNYLMAFCYNALDNADTHTAPRLR